MTSPFTIRTVPQFDRLLRRLSERHPELPALYAQALDILRIDPYNRSRQHNILKLTGVRPGEGGQYRLAQWPIANGCGIKVRHMSTVDLTVRHLSQYGS